jgi:hypothetical protein
MLAALEAVWLAVGCETLDALKTLLQRTNRLRRSKFVYLYSVSITGVFFAGCCCYSGFAIISAAAALT